MTVRPALRVARVGIAHEFFGHLFEVVTRLPHRYARDPRHEVPDLRMPSLRSKGSPLYYVVPVSPLTVLASVVAALAERRGTGRWGRTSAVAAQMVGSELVTTRIVRDVNARLFVAGHDLTGPEQETLQRRWYRLNAVRMALLGGAWPASREH